MSLNEKLPALNQYRYMVGACLLDDKWVAVYTQNGIFLLDTQADTLAAFPYAKEIAINAEEEKLCRPCSASHPRTSSVMYDSNELHNC